jgi:hypothetical protein
MRLVLCALVLTGCASRAARQPPRSPGEASQEPFGAAYESVRNGRLVAHAGGWVMEKTSQGVVRVREEAIPARVGRVANDDWISSRLTGETPVPGQVSVRSDGGVVQLRGVVDDEQAARRIIGRALETPGVGAVDSELVWPAQR